MLWHCLIIWLLNWNYKLRKHFSEHHNLVVQQLTGEVDIFTTWCEVVRMLCTKIIKIRLFFIDLFKNGDVSCGRWRARKVLFCPLAVRGMAQTPVEKSSFRASSPRNIILFFDNIGPSPVGCCPPSQVMVMAVQNVKFNRQESLHYASRWSLLRVFQYSILRNQSNAD